MIEILICFFLLGIVMNLEHRVDKIEKEFDEYKFEVAEEHAEMIKEIQRLEEKRFWG